MTNIRCPKCGAGTQWAIPDRVGTADCHEAGRTSRRYPPGWVPTCDWSGTIVRDDDGTIRIATDADADFIRRERAKIG